MGSCRCNDLLEYSISNLDCHTTRAVRSTLVAGAIWCSALDARPHVILISGCSTLRGGRNSRANRSEILRRRNGVSHFTLDGLDGGGVFI